ncbi:metal-binding protein [Anaerohalosphaera lusitana]|uniref:GTP cyclohydrolase 1 type 2 homolog n=1 Tax=Anaerohalosphaera lusitana TaxID=1936003 RepID=A0A1U9NIY6_9BACT|nr:Nif3-like dinuclear metal center hexameric protein [Anaerohalosphaera lusitana]AQT67747.1 metal-binding protein [Anaerohalosphaera lusitana]
MKVKDIGREINAIAPLGLALDWDNVGLLVGDENADVKNVLMTIDLTKGVLAEAKRKKVDMIMAYHPVIWDGLKKVTASGEGSIVYDLVRSGINVFSIHTAYDIAMGGVNDALAEIVGIGDAEPIGDFVENPAGDFYKVIVFVPAKSVNKVADAMFKAGAGQIGNYSKCSYRSDGQGTFLPMEGSNPAIGEKGRLEYVDEIKVESIVPGGKLEGVIGAMVKAHPYETPAYDVFREYGIGGKMGLGRMGELEKAGRLDDIVANIKKVTGAKALGMIGPEKKRVRKAAVCAGSCGNIVNTVMKAECDMYLTGELKHHQALAAQEAGLTCICLSHSVSERFALKNLAKELKKRLGDVKIQLSRKDADPFRWKNI